MMKMPIANLVLFKDLFVDSPKGLILKRSLTISGKEYEVGDFYDPKGSRYADNPQAYHYLVTEDKQLLGATPTN